MAADDFNPADLDELVAALRGADPTHELIRSVSLNPDEVQLPGVWVRFDQLEEDVLAGLTVRVTVHMIVSSAGGFARQLAGLAELRNLVKPVLATYGGPAGPTTRVGVILSTSAGAQPMPALAVPLDLSTRQPEE